MTIEKKAEEVTENILCKGCENHCSIFLCKSSKSFYAGALAGIEAGRKEREDEIKQIEQVNENRGSFIDWCSEHHEEILKEYTGFMEAQK